MKLLLLLAVGGAALIWGWAKIGAGDGKGMEKALYTMIIVVSAYIAMAALRSWPYVTPVRIFRGAFVPLGRWLNWVLGSG